MIGDEFLCKSRLSGKVDTFYSFDECRRFGDKTCGTEELGEFFFGLVHLENSISCL